MDFVQRTIRRLTVAALVFLCGPVFAGTMPNVQPISVEPVGVAPGGGIQARYTYEMRLPFTAANDGTVAAAANDASYATRLVTIGRGTTGGIIDAAVAGGSRLVPWIAAAVTAYQVYKWYKDTHGNTVASGQFVPPYDCSGGPYWVSNAGNACSLPGVEQQLKALHALSGWQNIQITCSMTSSTQATCTGSYTLPSCGCTGQIGDGASLYQGAPSGTADPAYTSDPTPVTPDQIGQLGEQHPDWWQGMLSDPNTGAPLITPEVAKDMDALKQQLAPQYGVDPTTLTPTQPDTHYQNGTADPRQPTALPSYCGWATAACDYYQWVEDHWPNKDPKTYTEADCKTPPACSGDDVLCAVARNTWEDKCAVSGDGTQPPQFGAHVVSEIDHGTQDVGDTSKLDSSGFGWGTACPFQDTSIEFNGQTVVIPFQPVCEYGPWMRALILILAGLKAAQIIAGLRDVAA